MDEIDEKKQGGYTLGTEVNSSVDTINALVAEGARRTASFLRSTQMACNETDSDSRSST
jgi:hypothetical protein